MSFPVNIIIKILYEAFIHSINLKKAGFGQPKYCNNAYIHVVLTNLCSIAPKISRGKNLIIVQCSTTLKGLLIYSGLIY